MDNQLLQINKTKQTFLNKKRYREEELPEQRYTQEELRQTALFQKDRNASGENAGSIADVRKNISANLAPVYTGSAQIIDPNAQLASGAEMQLRPSPYADKFAGPLSDISMKLEKWQAVQEKTLQRKKAIEAELADYSSNAHALVGESVADQQDLNLRISLISNEYVNIDNVLATIEKEKKELNNQKLFLENANQTANLLNRFEQSGEEMTASERKSALSKILLFSNLVNDKQDYLSQMPWAKDIQTLSKECSSLGRGITKEVKTVYDRITAPSAQHDTLRIDDLHSFLPTVEEFFAELDEGETGTFAEIEIALKSYLLERFTMSSIVRNAQERAQGHPSYRALLSAIQAYRLEAYPKLTMMVKDKKDREAMEASMAGLLKGKQVQKEEEGPTVVPTQTEEDAAKLTALKSDRKKLLNEMLQNMQLQARAKRHIEVKGKFKAEDDEATSEQIKQDYLALNNKLAAIEANIHTLEQKQYAAVEAKKAKEAKDTMPQESASNQTSVKKVDPIAKLENRLDLVSGLSNALEDIEKKMEEYARKQNGDGELAEQLVHAFAAKESAKQITEQNRKGGFNPNQYPVPKLKEGLSAEEKEKLLHIARRAVKRAEAARRVKTEEAQSGKGQHRKHR